MNNLVFKKAFYSFQKFAIDNLPTILTGMAVVGTITTAIFAVRATNEAKDILFEEENKDDVDYKRTVKEIVPLVWKCYIPTAIMGAATVGCILGSACVSARRQAAIAALYSLSEQNFKDYKDKAIEALGKAKAEKLDSESKEERVQKVFAQSGNGVSCLLEGYGGTICYDAFTGRLFKSDLEVIRQAVNDLNFRLLSELWIPLNEFYEEIGLKSCKLGYDVGWTVDHRLDFKYDAILLPNGEPCIYLDYNNAPIGEHGWR